MDYPETLTDIIREAATRHVESIDAAVELAARDEALDTVLEHAAPDWRASAREVAAGLRGDVAGEDVRLVCEAHGVRPNHPNAWGALILRLVADGVLVATGEYRPMRANGSHGRRTPVYRRATA